MKNKNIFVLPTTEPSQIYLIINENALGWTSKNPESMEHYGSGTHNQHAYITKKEPYDRGDWCIDVEAEEIFKVAEVKEYSGIVRSDTDTYVYDACVKIALTTDLKLIADGVQAIDNEFLQWFVKNSSCEEVEVKRDEKYDEEIVLVNLAGKVGATSIKKNIKINYKIIIPKEEPKKEYQTCKCVSNWFNTTVADKPFCFKCGKSVKEDFKPTEENCTCTDECLGYLTKTCKGIEETALRLYPNRESFLDRFQDIERVAFIKGYKLAQERSYSEEEVGEIVYNIIGEYGKHYGIMIDGRKLNQLFEQFKKKQEWKV